MEQIQPSLPGFTNPIAQGQQAQTGNRTLYVGNIDKDIDQQKLFAHFVSVHPNQDCIQSVNLKKDINGESRGFAFIIYKTEADAKRAKAALNHSKINENEISVSFLRQQDPEANSNLYIKNLNPNLSAKELEDLCAQYGNIVSCRLKYDSDGKSLGYGYVQFEKEQAATECIEGLKNRIIGEKAISVERFVPRSKRGGVSQKCNIYVKDFPQSFTDKQVEDYINTEFSKFGKITSKAISKDAKINKYYAFVAFEKPEEAKQVIDSQNGHVFPGEDSKLYVDFAQTKEQRRKLLREKHLSTTNQTNLFIKSLTAEVTEDTLRKAFEKYGPVTSLCVKTHELTKAGSSGEKKTLKFGFVNFAEPANASAALTQGKKDPEIKAMIDPNHFPNVEFLYMAQPKSVRSQYLKMNIKAKRSAQNLKKNQEQLEMFFKQMMNMTSGGRGRQGQRRPDQMQQNQAQAMFQNFGGMMQAMNPMGMGGAPMGMGMNPMLFNMMGPGGMMGAGGMPQQFFNPAMFQAQQMMPQQIIPQNMPQIITQQQIIPAPQAATVPAASKDAKWLKTHLEEFEAYSADEKKNTLGNMMFNRVKELSPPADLIPKITGMLIDLEVLTIQEIIEILENKEQLQERMQEAIKIIEEDNES